MAKELLKGQIQPQNLDAEHNVLGAMLLDAEAVDVALATLKPDDFYQTRHAQIYTTICELATESTPVDLLTVTNRLREKQQLKDVGGAFYLSELSEDVPTTATINHYVKIVKEKSLKRKLIVAANEMLKQAYSDSVPATEMLREIEQLIFSLSVNEAKTQFERLSGLMEGVLEILDTAHQHKSGGGGMMTGLEQLDALTVGLHPGELTILAGRPGMGKTALALTIALNLAKENVSVAIFSLEMAKRALAMRIILAEAKVDAQKARKGYLTRDDYNKVLNTINTNYELPIFIDDWAEHDILELRAKARRIASKQKLGVIMIDYLGLIHSGKRFESRDREVGYISKSAKAMAKELNIAVIMISQLSRNCTNRRNKRPRLSDLRDSGNIEQDADNVIFLYRDEMYHENTENSGIAELILAKQRNGPVGTAEVAWISSYTKFENLAQGDMF